MALTRRFDAILRALENRNYRIYTIGNICSHFGMWAYRIALQWLTWQLTGSAFWLGAIAMADLFPTVILAPIAGAVTERVNRLGMMRFSMLFTTLQATTLAVLCFTGHISIWIVFTLTLLLGLVLAFNHPVRLVIVPNMVERETLASAVAINSLVFNIARVAGPSIAGGIIAAAGEGAAIAGAGIVFAFNAAANAVFTGALFMVALTRQLLPRSTASLGAIPDEIVEGFRYAARHAGIGPLLAILFIVGLSARTYIDLFAGFVDRVYGLGPEALGLLTSSVGLGAVIGGLWLAQRGEIEGLTRIVLSNIVLLALVLVVFTATDIFWLGLVCVFVAGFSMTAAGTGEHTLIQAAVDEHMRGRVVSLYGAVSRGCPSLGALIMGYIGDRVGLRWPVAGGAVLCIGLWLWAFTRRKRLAAALETAPADRGH